MSRPKLQDHLRRLLTDEKIYIMSLFETETGSGKWFCSMAAPAINISEALADGGCYAYVDDRPTAEDAVHDARNKLWNGL